MGKLTAWIIVFVTAGASLSVLHAKERQWIVKSRIPTSVVEDYSVATQNNVGSIRVQVKYSFRDLNGNYKSIASFVFITVDTRGDIAFFYLRGTGMNVSPLKHSPVVEVRWRNR